MSTATKTSNRNLKFIRRYVVVENKYRPGTWVVIDTMREPGKKCFMYRAKRRRKATEVCYKMNCLHTQRKWAEALNVKPRKKKAHAS
jgi:hypothetical protein